MAFASDFIPIFSKGHSSRKGDNSDILYGKTLKHFRKKKQQQKIDVRITSILSSLFIEEDVG